MACCRAAKPADGGFRLGSHGAVRNVGSLHDRGPTSRRAVRPHARRQTFPGRPLHPAPGRIRTLRLVLHLGTMGANPVEVLEAVRDEVAVIRTPEWHRFPHSFNQIFAGGYASGYYSYLWAEVLAADGFGRFCRGGHGRSGDGQSPARRDLFARRNPPGGRQLPGIPRPQCRSGQHARASRPVASRAGRIAGRQTGEQP